MEYFRDPKNRTQAGFALNAGKLLIQYDALTTSLPPSAKFDATLAICVLQSLLTNCAELLRAMKADRRGVFREDIPDIPYQWGIRRSFVKTNTFPDNLTYEKFVEHLRNALSHPTSSEVEHHPSTGYTTLPDGSGVISTFMFIDSPWVTRGRLHTYSSRNAAEKKINNGFSKLELEIVPKSDGKFEIRRGSEPYIPLFVGELPLVVLKELAVGLSNHLAQPVIENWDGKTIQRLVA